MEDIQLLKKVGVTFFIIIAILGTTFYWNWNGNIKLTSHTNPLSRVMGELTENIKGKMSIFQEDDEVTKLIEQMSIDEKVGQLIFAGMTGTTMTEETRRMINEYKVGGIILFANNLNTPEQSIQLIEQIKQENDDNVLPLFLGVDQEGGRVERLPDVVKLPANIVVGKKDDEQYSHGIGELLGMQLNAFGFNLNFAPVLDVNSNPNNPVIGDRSFGDDPELVGKLGIQTMNGLKSQQVIPVVKHFPGHGDTDVDSHLELPLVDKNLAELEALELIPFKQAIVAGAEVVMTAHILLPQIDDVYPASMSEAVIHGILREQLGFDGIVMTDDLTMQAISDHFDMGVAAVNAIKAGTDIVLMAHNFAGLISVFESLKQAVVNGDITEERINESVRRIATLKEKYLLEERDIERLNVGDLNERIQVHLDQ